MDTDEHGSGSSPNRFNHEWTRSDTNGRHRRQGVIGGRGLFPIRVSAGPFVVLRQDSESVFIGVHPWFQSERIYLSKECGAGAFNLQNPMSNESPKGGEETHENAGFLERTFAEQRAPLTRYATRLLGDPERARDVVQDAFVKFMAQPADAINGHAVEWLFTVCRNRAMDVLRKEHRMKRFEEGQVERVTTAEPRPGSALEQAETQAVVLRLINRLPPNQQEVVRLKFQNGFSYKEISRITTLSVSNVGFLIHTAVMRMRTEFAAQR